MRLDRIKSGKAAAACDLVGRVAHNLGDHTDVCYLARKDPKGKSIVGLILDSGVANRGKLNHRRWCLNPAMSELGFGVFQCVGEGS